MSKRAKKCEMYGYLQPLGGEPLVWTHDDEEIIGEVGGKKTIFEFFIHSDGTGIINLLSPSGMTIDRIIIRDGRFVQDEDWIRLNTAIKNCKPSPDRRTTGSQSEGV